MQQLIFVRRSLYFLTISLLLSLSVVSRAQSLPAQTPPPVANAPQQSGEEKKDVSPSPSSQVPGDNAELSSQDAPTTFKVRVNLVLVRAVVRDAHGQVVSGLRKEDFQLLDNRKPQVISSFSAETPESLALKPTANLVANENGVAGSAPVEPGIPPVPKLPQRFVALLFDDLHLSLEDSTFVRAAATRFFGALAPSDRVGIFTTSGQFTQTFTADHEMLQKSLFSIVPRAVTGGGGFHDCPDMTYYQADLIQNRHDPQALAVAAEDAVECAFGGDETKLAQASNLALSVAGNVVVRSDSETDYAYRHIEEAMHRLELMPGQRIIVFVSPGFLPNSLSPDTADLVDRATRSSIVINTIDARGLFAPDLMGDIADPPLDARRTKGFKASYRVQSQLLQNKVLEQLAEGTGGTFFHNRNDVDEGLRQAGAAPPLSYLLGFSPQNMKVDGRFHTIKVTLTNQQKYSIQARNGYYAPKSIANPEEAAKREIQEAIFSQDEMHDVPVELQTQFFMKDAGSARLSVLTRFDVRSIHFHKVDGRNHDNLTIATAIFDENGNFVTGGEKTVQMKLLDTTYNRLSRSGLTLKSSYDVKPGSYLVRLVVRDGEGSQMAARNGAVVIPN
jgi:VWFA-related protein